MTAVYVTAPRDVAACDLGPVTVLVDYRNGRVHTLLGPSATWWAQLASTGDISKAGVLDTQTAEMLLERLRTVGLLKSVARPEPWPGPVAGLPWLPSWGTQEVQAGRIPVPRAPRRLLAAGLLALLLTLAIQHIGRRETSMARLTALLRWATARTTHPATSEQARHAVYAVRRAGMLAAGRVACLEESAAVVLTLALYRRRVTWCHGVAADPVRLHAWVDNSDGDPVAEPASTARYTKLRTIPEM